MQKGDISCFGYGKTTRAIARRFGPCTFYDDKISKPLRDEEGNRLKPVGAFYPPASKLEIPSPGFPPSHPLISQARNLVSEYDLFAESMPFSIWISGTNGKTTTTQMTTHMLTDKGAQSGGNIGTPLAELDENAPLWVLETSSFTLHYTNRAKPDIYALLPVTPDHLSWHGGMQAYIDAKLKPVAQMREGEAVILPKALIEHLPATRAYLIPYENSDDLARYFGFNTDMIRFKGAFLFDALIAMAIDKILYDRCDYERINAFTLDPHRQEEFRDKKGRLWVNDTKATNPDAALAALQTYAKERIHLIVGGDDKGVDLHPFFEALKQYDVTLYAIGSNESKVCDLAKHSGIPCRGCTTLENAVSAIDAVHTLQSVALLSPAAASLDQFSSYMERGERFKAKVLSLS